MPSDFEHLRHQPPSALDRPRALVVACPPMRSNINLSRIVRTCGCFGVQRVIACGTAKVVAKIARDAVALDGDEKSENESLSVEIEVRRTLAPVLAKLKAEGYRLVGLEQTTNSHNLHEYEFPRETVLVIGNERHGIADDILALLDDVVEIPVYGQPDSLNAATAASMAIYEYCRQFPRG